jgi:hypothetical protein
MTMPVPHADAAGVDFLPLPPAATVPAGLSALADPGLEIGVLLRFKSLMAGAGQPVQLDRLCHDRNYACERIAAAHAFGDAPLRRLALELVQIWHRRSPGLPAQ